MNGRKKSYRNDEINGVPCIKCKAPSEHQFRICSKSMWTAVCSACDFEINRIVALWAFGDSDGSRIVDEYAKREMKRMKPRRGNGRVSKAGNLNV